MKGKRDLDRKFNALISHPGVGGALFILCLVVAFIYVAYVSVVGYKVKA